MDSPPITSPLRSRRLKALRVPAALLGLAFIYVAVVGIAIDMSAQGAALAARLGAALGREIRLSGDVQLEISARPTLRISGLRIANAPGFGEGGFASLGEARLALNLWPLLWGRLQVDELAGSDAHLSLQVRKDGANNWTFRSSPPAASTQGPTASGPMAGHALALDIRRVSLQRLEVQFVGADGLSHYFHLDSLVARIPSGQPVSLSLNGTVEKSFPYRVEFTGGTLADLLDAERPWPVDLSLNFLSSQLLLKGTVSGNRGNLHFGLATGDLEEIARLLQTRLPAVGSTRLEGDVAFAPGRLTLTRLDGRMGHTTLEGDIEIDHGGARPRLAGRLSLPVLDLRPFLTAQPAAGEEPGQGLAAIWRDLAQARFDLHALNGADADLTLHIGKWLNMPGAVQDATLQVQLDHGRLSMPVRATIAGVTVTGSARVDARKSPSRFELALATRHSRIGGLAGLLLGIPDVEGELARFKLHVGAQGNRGAELMESLVVQLGVEQARLTYGNGAGARPVQLALDQFTMELPAGSSLRGEARGTLLDNPFSISLRGASLQEIVHGTNAAFDFALQAGSARATAHARLPTPAADAGAEVAFLLDAPHSSEVASWFGLKPGADVPVSVKGSFQTHDRGWLLSDFVFQLGRSRLSAEARQVPAQNAPLVQLQLNAEQIDADELKSLLPEAPAASPSPTAPPTAAMIDVPVLPRGVSLADADIAVRIHKVVTTSPFTVQNLRFDGRIRDGMMSTSPFAARVAGTDFTGAVMLDLRTQQPRATFWLAGEAMDVGRLLRGLDLAHDLDARVDRLHLYLDLHSSRLGELLARSEMSAGFEGGFLHVRDANSGARMRIALESGELRSAPGTAVQLKLDGALGKTPVKLRVETAAAADLLNPALSIPFTLDAAAAGATLRLSGDVKRPVSQQEVELALEVRGNRLHDLNPLLRASLPPWGPWSASGRFHMSPAGYEVSSLQLQVGSSQLQGRGRLDTRAAPPRLEVELAAPNIQLDDFRFGNWSPERSRPAAAAARPAAGEPAPVQQLLSREVLLRQNARLSVRVDQVLSGDDVLGNGKLELRLQDGRAEVGPVVVNTPGGTATVRFDYEPGEKDVAINFRAEASRFDYGVLARRLDKRSGLRGTFDLDVELSARAQRLSELLRYGEGRIDFALWPENMKSGMLDLWAVNVLVALLPAVDSTRESKVNCAIGQFRVQGGRLSHKRILVDTTRMRVLGRGDADFTTEQFRFYMRPRSKTPQFFSFPLPVEVSGGFDDFSVGVRPGDVLETTGQFLTSIVWVPVQSLFGNARPADGSDICRLKK